MKRLLSTCRSIALLAGLLAGAMPACAADLALRGAQAAAAVYNWTGLSIEGYGLYGANITNAAITDGTGTTLAELATTPHGPGIGGGFTYRWQMAPGGFGVGVRANIAYANFSGGSSVSNSLNVHNATNYFGDVSPFVFLPLSSDGRLIGTLGGGFAYIGAKPDFSVFGGERLNLAKATSDTSTGWGVFGRLDYALDQHWGVFIEGQYLHGGDKSLSFTDSSGAPVMTSLNKYGLLVQKIGVDFKL